MIRRNQIIAACLCGLSSAECRRVETGGHDSARSEAPPARDQKGSVRTLVVGQLRLFLDSSQTLTSIQDVLGESPVVRPRHHDDFWSVCYAVATNDGWGELRLLSNEIGGPDHVLLGFDLTVKTPQDPSPETTCPVIRDKAAKVITENGLSLGMPISELLSVMGTPATDSNGEYGFESSRSIEAQGKSSAYDITASLRVETKSNRVTALRAWYVKTT